MTNSGFLSKQSSAPLVVDATFGNDTTASRYGSPFKTLTAAKNAALSGDTILVLPGTYNESDLLKNGVNWFFEAGATVSWTQITPNYYGIFDDRSSGAVTCLIDGFGKFVSTISNATNVSKATILISNAGTDIKIRCAQILADGGYNATQAAVQVLNCARCHVTADVIGTTGFVFGTPGASATSGVYWVNGPLTVVAKYVGAENNGLWSDDSGGANPSVDFYSQVDWVQTNNAAALYHSGHAGNANFRSWHMVKLVQNYQYTSPVAVFTDGKFYLISEKLEAQGTGGGAIAMSGGAVQAWITVQKISGPTSWLQTTGTFTGQLYLTVMHYDDPSSTVNPGWNVDGTGKIFFFGGYAKISNGKGIDQVSTATIRAMGLVIDTSNTNGANNVPVRVAGASGVILDRCTLVSGALAKCVLGTAAGKTVKNYASKANQAVDAANVTVQVDVVTVDANVA